MEMDYRNKIIKYTYSIIFMLFLIPLKATYPCHVDVNINSSNNWIDILHYDINIKPDIIKKELNGQVEIKFKALRTNHILQLALYHTLVIDSIFEKNYTRHHKIKITPLKFKRNHNIFTINFYKSILHNQKKNIIIYYHGKPLEAINPPWNGGVIWKKDSLHNPFISVACQELGAFVWMPCKNDLSDEPNEGINISITASDTLKCIGNGRLVNTEINKKNKTKTWTWKVKNPINNYNINFTVGNLQNFTSTYYGKKGKLNLSFWVLAYNLQKAKKHFLIVNDMLRIFEKWFGPYPFYVDDYKLVETPFLGMEHQSSIAYGNNYKNGYNGIDLSNTGHGLKWDFIIIHESGHEWFGNNITGKTIGDLWIQESFTNYSETLFIEDYINTKSANEYCYGIREKILNDTPIFISSDVHGSQDMYYKGGNMIHTIRNAVYNDKKFKAYLLKLNTTFYHKIVSTQEIEKFTNRFFSYNFSPVFNQYLRTTHIPELEYYIENNEVFLRWENCVSNFNLPILIKQKNIYTTVIPTNKWEQYPITKDDIEWWKNKEIEKYFYLKLIYIE